MPIEQPGEAVVSRRGTRRADPGPHESALFDLQAKYAEVVDEDKVVSWLGTVIGKVS